MAKLINDRLIRALLRQPIDCTPVWIMRQAGRYLPEYRAVRQKAGDFLTLCQTPELACEVTLQPLRRFDLDAAIIFSDILTIPDAMGLGLHFVEGEGPRFRYKLNSYQQILDLPVPDPEQKLRYVMDAIRLTKRELHDKVPLIGFAGSPWTLAAYMLEGGSSKQYSQARALCYREPKSLHTLLTRLTQATILYLNAQIQAGADAVMLFDTWGGLLTATHYREFSLQYMQQIVAGLQRQQTDRYVPVIIFTKGGGLWLEQIAQSGCEAVGLDWTISIGEARKRIGNKVALQGNLDPAALYSTPVAIKSAVTELLTSYGAGSGHVFNLGHGIEPDVPPEHVQVLVDAVHEHKITSTSSSTATSSATTD